MELYPKYVYFLVSFRKGEILCVYAFRCIVCMHVCQSFESMYECPLEKEMANYSNILAWEIPWTEEPGRLQSMASQRVGHDLVTKQHTANIKGDWKYEYM